MNVIVTRQDPDELYHYGVLGMKWGHRKPQVEAARSAYKQAKKDYKSASKNLRKGQGVLGFGYAGINGLSKFKKNESKVNKAEMDMIRAKANLKASKAKNAEKAKKAEFNTYRKEMQKSGLVGSAMDNAKQGRSTRIYNELKAKKGKEYADAVQKKVQNVAVAEFCTGATVAIGAAIVQGYLTSRN